eukprot:4362737-Prymnesium_polylepis.1
MGYSRSTRPRPIHCQTPYRAAPTVSDPISSNDFGGRFEELLLALLPWYMSKKKHTRKRQGAMGCIHDTKVGDW